MKRIIFLIVSLAVVQNAYSAPQEAQCGGKKIYISGKKVLWDNVDSGDPLSVYEGKYKPNGIIACGTGVVTTFRMKDGNNAKGSRKKWPKDYAYYSPNCRNVGGGGETIRVYRGKQVIVSLSQPTGKPGIIARWKRPQSEREKSYYSPDCKKIGGGGDTVRLN